MAHNVGDTVHGIPYLCCLRISHSWVKLVQIGLNRKLAMVYHIDGLNCYESHKRQMQPGDELRYGWAIAPDNRRYQHTWIKRAGIMLDLFGWRNHEDMGKWEVKKDV